MKIIRRACHTVQILRGGIDVRRSHVSSIVAVYNNHSFIATCVGLFGVLSFFTAPCLIYRITSPDTVTDENDA